MGATWESLNFIVAIFFQFNSEIIHSGIFLYSSQNCKPKYCFDIIVIIQLLPNIHVLFFFCTFPNLTQHISIQTSHVRLVAIVLACVALRLSTFKRKFMCACIESRQYEYMCGLHTHPRVLVSSP